jgi:hypothetical protein
MFAMVWLPEVQSMASRRGAADGLRGAEAGQVVGAQGAGPREVAVAVRGAEGGVVPAQGEVVLQLGAHAEIAAERHHAAHPVEEGRWGRGGRRRRGLRGAPQGVLLGSPETVAPERRAGVPATSGAGGSAEAGAEGAGVGAGSGLGEGPRRQYEHRQHEGASKKSEPTGPPRALRRRRAHAHRGRRRGITQRRAPSTRPARRGDDA